MYGKACVPPGELSLTLYEYLKYACEICNMPIKILYFLILEFHFDNYNTL